jgi:hypothetical protein
MLIRSCPGWLFLPTSCRVLLTAYAAHLQPEWFTEAAYLWAVELWYAYAIQVRCCCVDMFIHKMVLTA